MSRTILVALLVLLGLFAVSVLAVDTEISLQATSNEVTPELADSLSAVHDAVNEAEMALAAEDEMYGGEEDESMFLEMEEHMEGESDAESDSDAETEMEESLGLDADTEGEALFFEMGADLYAEAEMDAEDAAEFDSESDSDAESDVEVEHETDAEFGSVTVHEAEAGHEQSADPIVTEQMETDAALKDFGFLEADADADADADAEADAELDAEMESGEEQVATTGCGKKIIWERNQEPNPEATPAASEPAPVQA